MSLQQHASDERRVIDLTNGPIIDLTSTSYFSADHSALAEAANRLLMALPSNPTRPGHSVPATLSPSEPGWRAAPTFDSRFPKRPAHQINVMAILAITAIAGIAMLLVGISATGQY
jgi:hypothetical protein